MTVRQSLPLNSKYIKMGPEVMRGEGGGGGVQANGLHCKTFAYLRSYRLGSASLTRI